MASNKTFPSSRSISPSVRFIERDLSLVPSATTSNNIGIVGFASKGPVNEVTTVRSLSDLHATFGYPHPDDGDPYMIYAAELALRAVNSIQIVRVADVDPASGTSADLASKDVVVAGTAAESISDTVGPYVLTTDENFRWKLNGVLASKTLTVLAGTYAVADLVDELNSQLTSVDGIEFFVSDDLTLGVRTTFSYGVDASLELVSVLDAMYGSTSVVGLGTLMEEAEITGTATKYPDNAYVAAGTYDFTALTDVELHIVIDGTGNVNIDNVVQVVSFESISYADTEVVSLINTAITNGDIPGGFIASVAANQIVLTTLHAGSSAKLLVKSSSTADTLFGFANITSVGVSPEAQTGDVDTYTAGVVTGTTGSSPALCFTLEADSVGIEGNNTQVVIANNKNNGTFSIQVFTNGFPVENFSGLSKDPSSDFYFVDYLASNSRFVRADDNTTVLTLPKPGTYVLAGGTDGIPASAADQDSLLVGSDVAMTGLQAFSVPEQVNIDLLLVPGHASTTVATAIRDICENRGDCLGLVDPPFALSVSEVVQWQNGVHPLNDVRIDSDFCALYWPWVSYRDTTNNVDVWVPPSSAVAPTIALSDAIGGGPWWAPAGETRGVVNNIGAVYSTSSLTERDFMYSEDNCVNPITQFGGTGAFVIWGQKTMQRTATSLNRIAPRRMLFYIEKTINDDANSILFEPHDEILRNRFIRIATSRLETVKNARGLTDYFVKCDTELNTPDVIDRGELRAQIGIQPMHAVEFVFIEFSLHRTGSFIENA